MRRFLRRAANLFHGGGTDRELAREIASHLAMLADDFERRGLSPADAKLAARRAYGGVEQAKEMHRDVRSFPWVEQGLKDLRYGARGLLRTPAFTAVAVLTLALGIGANTAVFSVVNAVLLRPLAYHDPERLVTLLHDGTGPVAPANYADWRDQAHSFSAMGAAEYWAVNAAGSQDAERIVGLRVTQNLLPALGVAPLLGRLFADGEDRKGADHVLVLSHRLWQRRFNGDSGVLGSSILLNGEAYTIVGVMPPGFQFAPFWATRAELWAPLALADRYEARGGNSLRVFARLTPGTPLARARAEIATITSRLEQQYPGTNRNVVVTPLKENVVGKVETPLLVLLGAVGFVLLIACANVAHMLLARTSDRQREMALRTALGASRARVAVQLLTESLLLASLGAGAGLLLAIGGVQALVALSPARLPRLDMVGIDAGVVLFLAGITVLTALVFGLAPTLRADRARLSDSLKEGGRGGSDGVGRNRLRGFLVASEFALAFVLLIGAGLMIRSFFALQSVTPGFDPHNVLSMVVSVTGSKEADAGRREIFYRQMLQKVGSLPGVSSVGAINHLPLAGDEWGWPFRIAGRPAPRPGESPMAVYRIVMPGYFETMRLPLVRGRAIAYSDDARSTGVVVINERAARQYWPGEDPLGKRIAFGADTDNAWLTVIGVAANAKQSDWTAEPHPEVYRAALQTSSILTDPRPQWSYLTLVVRTAGNAADMAPAVKRAVWSLERNLPISEVLTMEQAVAEANAQPRFEMLLFAVFAAVALVLAAVGIYGVMSYAVARRTHEIGIRMSLGASPGDVLWIVVRQGMGQALAGTAAGIVGALLLARFMARMLYGVRPADLVTFGGVAVVLGLVAFVAAWLPARRATRIDPMVALRND